MEQKDYYQILGLKSDATPELIKDAYRRLAFEYHPDRNKDDGSRGERMKLINEAYAVLSHPAKRKEYDVLRRSFGASAHGHFRQAHSEHDIFRNSDINAVFEDMARMYGFRGFRDVFKDFYGPAFQQFEFQRPGLHIRGFVLRGGPRPWLQKSGVPFLAGRLGRFLGLKEPFTPAADGQDVFDEIVIPAQLADSGGGRHYFLKHLNREIILKIPPNVYEGRQIRLAGMGEPGRAGGIAGDLYLRIKIKKPWWQYLLQWLFPPKN